MHSGMVWIFWTVGILVVLLIILTVYFALHDRAEKKPLSGRSALEGEIGVASTDLNPEGRVMVHGEWWNARADGHIPEGTKVKVVKAEKMLLSVVRAPDE